MTLRPLTIVTTTLLPLLFASCGASSTGSAIALERPVLRSDVQRLIGRYREYVIPLLDESERSRDEMAILDVETMMAISGSIPVK